MDYKEEKGWNANKILFCVVAKWLVTVSRKQSIANTANVLIKEQ